MNEHIGSSFDSFLKDENLIDVYECLFYPNKLQMCKYYPKFCSKCAEPIKIGTIYESEGEE